MDDGKTRLRQYRPRAARIILSAVLLVAWLLVPASAVAKPKLDDASVSPRSGSTSTTFQFNVTFTGERRPDRVVVRIGATEYVMGRSGSGGGCDDDDDDCKDREYRYTFAGKFSVGTHPVEFQSYGENNTAAELSAGSIKVSGPAPTPKPKPKPTPKPTPKATPKPTRKPPPKATPEPTPRPSPKVIAAANTAPSPTPTASATPTPKVAAAPLPSVPPQPPPDQLFRGSALDVPEAFGGYETIVLDDVRLSSTITAYAWMVPGFLLGLPGLLILLIVGAQMLAASLFVPLTRRMLGGRTRPHGPPGPQRA